MKRLVMLVAVVLGLLGANISGADAALPPNPNPVNWNFSYGELFHASISSSPITFREGQHDKAGYTDGFGKAHVRDGHNGVIPDDQHITNALNGSCQQTRDGSGNVVKYTCKADGTLVVVDPKAPAASRHCNYECSYMTGIITAYYT